MIKFPYNHFNLACRTVKRIHPESLVHLPLIKWISWHGNVFPESINCLFKPVRNMPWIKSIKEWYFHCPAIVSTLKYLIFLNSRFLLNPPNEINEGSISGLCQKYEWQKWDRNVQYRNIGISKVIFGMFRKFFFLLMLWKINLNIWLTAEESFDRRDLS